MDVNIRIKIDASGATRGAQQVKTATDQVKQSTKSSNEEFKKLKAELKRLSAENKKLAADLKKIKAPMDKAGKSAGRFTRSANQASRALREMSASVAVLQGPLGPVAGRIGALSAAVGRLNPLLLVGALGFAGFTAALKSSFAAADLANRGYQKIVGGLQATGNASGLTANEIESFARGLARATLASTAEVREASTQLLTFKSISGDTFKRALKVSQDLASAGFGTLKTASIQLAKALEDPAIGLSSLRKVGVTFTQTQQDMIKSLNETGQKAEAMGLILEAVEGQVKGLAEAEANSLAGATDSLSQSWNEFLEEVGNSGPLETAKSAIMLLDGAIQGLTFSLFGFSALKDLGIEKQLALANDQVGLLTTKLGLTDKQLKEINDKVKEGQSDFRIIAGLQLRNPSLLLLNDDLEELVTYLRDIKELEPQAQSEKEAKAEAERAKAQKEANDEADRRNKLSKDAIAKLTTLEANLRKQANTTGRTAEETLRWRLAEGDLVQVLKEANEGTEEQRKNASELIGRMYAAARAIDAKKEADKAAKDALREANEAERERIRLQQEANRLLEQFDPGLAAARAMTQFEQLAEINPALEQFREQAARQIEGTRQSQARALTRLLPDERDHVELLKLEAEIMESKAQERYNAGLTNTVELIDEQNAGKEKLIDAYRQEIDYLRQAGVAMDALPIQMLNEKIRELEEGIVTVGDRLKDVIQGPFETFFNDVLNGTKTLKDAFIDLANTIVQEVNKIIAKDLANSLSGYFGGLANEGGFFGSVVKNLIGGSSNTLLPAGSGIGASALGVNLPGFQTGGSFTVGGTGVSDNQLVAFRATPGEKVTVTPKGGSGEGMVINNNFYVSAPQGTIDRESQQQVAARVGTAVQSALRRNR